MNGFHRGVKAHGPPPKERRAFAGCASVGDLFDFALTAVPRDRQDGGTVHRKQESRTIKEHDRQRMERVVEEVAVAQGEGCRPIQVRKDAKWHGLSPRTHEDGPEKAKDQIEPYGRREGPWHVRAHAQFASPPVGAPPPQEQRQGQEQARNQPPPPLIQRRQAQTVTRRRRLQRQPEQLPNELNRVVIDGRQHVHADDRRGDDAADDGRQSQSAQVDGAKLRVADLAQPMREERLAISGAVARPKRYAIFEGAANLDGGEDVLVVSHV